MKHHCSRCSARRRFQLAAAHLDGRRGRHDGLASLNVLDLAVYVDGAGLGSWGCCRPSSAGGPS